MQVVQDTMEHNMLQVLILVHRLLQRAGTQVQYLSLCQCKCIITLMGILQAPQQWALWQFHLTPKTGSHTHLRCARIIINSSVTLDGRSSILLSPHMGAASSVTDSAVLQSTISYFKLQKSKILVMMRFHPWWGWYSMECWHKSCGRLLCNFYCCTS